MTKNLSFSRASRGEPLKAAWRRFISKQMRTILTIFLIFFSSAVSAKNFTNSNKSVRSPGTEANKKFSPNTNSCKLSMQKINKFQFRKTHSTTPGQTIFSPNRR